MGKWTPVIWILEGQLRNNEDVRTGERCKLSANRTKEGRFRP